MIVKFASQYKSLGGFESDSMENFSVITGKNGSGKTQLIELFRLTKDKKLSTLSLEPELKKLQIEELEVKNFEQVNPQFWRDKVQNVLAPVKNIGYGILHIIQKLEEANLDWETVSQINIDFEMQKAGIDRQALRKIPELQRSSPPRMLNDVVTFLLGNKHLIPLLRFVSTQLNIPIQKLNELSFTEVPIPEKYLDSDLFKTQIEITYYAYLQRRVKNKEDFMEKTLYEGVNNSIPDTEFVQKNPNPLYLLNKIFAQYNIKYYFPEVELRIFKQSNLRTLKLKNLHTGAEIDPGDLSPGEKVIIGLILRLFNTKYYNEQLNYPELVLLDEPDAYLHPELSKLLIDVLYEVFVKEYGIKVIMTTHSPSTIAVAPDNSIYELKNEPLTSLKKISKDDALKVLTENIPTLSIDYKNHRQVFVESPTDQYYYTAVFNKLLTDGKTTFRLYFISNGYGKSDASYVSKIVSELRNGGNKSCYALIDWDLKNTSDKSKFIYVHGENRRYNIENYILDPVFLAMLFLEQGCKSGIIELGFNEFYNQYRLADESNERLQEIADWIIAKFVEKNPTYKNKLEEKIEYKYYNNKKINVPKWYAELNGHDLLEKFKECFPSLGQFRDEGELQKEVSQIIGKSFPLVPVDTVNIILAMAT